MALIVEDGSNVAGADALVSLVVANTHHAAMGNATWTGSDEIKEQAIRRATAVLGGYSWAGYRTHGRLQSLSWPRAGVVDVEGYGLASNEIPTNLQIACAELALRELVSPGSLTPDFTAGAAVKREKVDSLEVEYSNPAQNVSGVRPVVSVVAALIGPFLSSGSLSSPIVGVTVRT